MNHVQIRHALVKGITRVLMPGALPVTLFDDQRETLESTVRWLSKPKASRAAYVAQATGLGKTIEQAAIVAACDKLRVLLIVPTKIMVAQFLRDMINFTEGTIAHASSLKDVDDGKGNFIATHWRGQRHDVLVATDETFKAKFELIKRELDPEVIIWDECHWSYTKPAQRALAAFPDAVVVAFSATPDYLTTTAKSGYIPVTLDNGQVLYGPSDKFARTYYPELLDERTARWGIQHGRLASLAWGQLEFALNLDDVPVVDGPGGMDFDQAVLQHVMRKNWPFIVQVVRKLYESGQYDLARRFAAAVCPGIDESETLAEELRGIGLAAEAITRKTKDKVRDAILERGRHGELQMLSSVFVLREGWNSPNAEVAMMLRPTKSRVLYVQFMGRVLRLFGEKVALVLDPHYQNMRFAPLSAPVLFGTPGQVVYSGDMLVGGTRGGAAVISPYLLWRLEPVLTVQPLQIEYWAGEDGTFEADGETWTLVAPAATLLGVSENSIRNRIPNCRKRQGKDAGGLARTFYAFLDIRTACADLLADLPQAGEDGTFEADGEVWGTQASSARLLEISEPSVAARIRSCTQRQGRDPAGSVRPFYPLSDIRKVCADLLEVQDQAGEDGTFEADGEVWIMPNDAAELLVLSPATVRVRLSSCRKRQGKDRSKRATLFYPLSDIRKVCADLLEVQDQAGEDGTFEADGDVWVTAKSAPRLLRVSKRMVNTWISSCRQRKGKAYNGTLRIFYAVSDLRRACQDEQSRKK